MSRPRFTDEVLHLFPQHRGDMRELEKILAQHESIDVRDVPFPRKGPGFLRESMICRMLTFAFTATIRSQRLLEAAVREFNEWNLHAVYVLVRSHLELAALTRYASRNIQTLLRDGRLEELDQFLEQLVLGNLYMSKEHDYPVKPFHIGSVVRELDEIAPRISHTYYFLSEYTHPNMGSVMLSAEMDGPGDIARFSRRIRPRETDFLQTINLLVGTGQLTLKEITEILLLDVSALTPGAPPDGTEPHLPPPPEVTAP